MMTVDREATKYIGLTIKWDYKNGNAQAYMPGYLGKAMTHFGHKKTNKIQNSPHPHKNHPIRRKNSICRQRR
jgi:hypothetical protein